MNEKTPLQLVGALWLNRSESGRTYLNGNVDIGTTRHKVLIFKNDKEAESNKPDYRIMLAKSEPVPVKTPGKLPTADSDEEFGF